MDRLPGWFWLLAGAVVLAGLATGGVVTVNYLTAAWMASSNAQKWAPVLAQAEQAYGLPDGLLARMAYQESGFKQSVIDGTESSSAGALGILQLEPQYFDSVVRPIPFTDQDTSDQITQAAAQMAHLYTQLLPIARATGQNPWALALAGYNAGAGAVQQYAGVPPYMQTQNYVTAVLADVPNAIPPGLPA